MKPSSKRILAVAAILAVLLVAYVLIRLPGKSDQAQILAQLESARAAAEHHNANGIMKIISAHYQDARFNNDSLAFFLRRIANQGGSVTVTLATSSVQVHGDTADSVSQVTVRENDGGQVAYDNPVTLHWKREEGTRWLVFPAKVWRVVSADYQIPGLGDEGGGLF